MLFSSLIFLFVFLPLILLFYYCLREEFKNYILLLFSLLFYAWGGVNYAILLVASILFNYAMVKCIENSITGKRIWLSFGLVVNVAIIVVFKYLDFMIENLNTLGSLSSDKFDPFELKNIVLPLGISFFTFQQMSLLWDVYRDPSTKKTTLLNTALYISFFPQLVAGPIVRYNDIIEQIESRFESVTLFRSGVQRFILGLFKKIIFANTCGEIADSIMDAPIDNIGMSAAWLGIVAYSLQIYFDFSGYSDMAIGLGRMFGFNILENFNFPYISRSIKEFWRRWHISLSSWFKDYVYIPLGGNKKGKKFTYLNLIIVFLLTGFWHGATWSFVIWGLFHGSFLIIERLGFDSVLNRIPRLLSWAYTILVVMLGWVLFRIEEFSDAIRYISKLFGHHFSSGSPFLVYLDKEKLLILLLAIVSSSKLFYWLRNEFKQYESNNLVVLLKDGVLVMMFLYAVIYINSGSYNPFIYFRF